MTSPLAHLPGQTLLGAAHDVEARWPKYGVARHVPAPPTFAIYVPPPATLTSAPELEVWRHRDPGAAP